MLRRFILSSAAVLTLAAFAGAASAQTDTQRNGCSRDVSRLCRSVMNDGDSAVLSCLQQNRAKVSKACQKILTENGQ